MSEAFLGEIRMFGFDFPPNNWAFCNGALLPISQNTALFQILGTNFGGDGKRTFGLPNVGANLVVGAGQAATGTNYAVGQTGGASMIGLTSNTSPAHMHTFGGGSFRNDGKSATPDPAFVYGNSTNADCKPYLPSNTSPVPTMVAMDPRAIGPAGVFQANGTFTPTFGGQPHNNQMPYVVMSYCICVAGQTPARG